MVRDDTCIATTGTCSIAPKIRSRSFRNCCTTSASVEVRAVDVSGNEHAFWPLGGDLDSDPRRNSRRYRSGSRLRRSVKSRGYGTCRRRSPCRRPAGVPRIVTARNQNGVALISILLVVALVTALMYHLMTQQSFVVAQTRQVIRADQSLAYALGAEAYARQILFDDWNRPESRLLDTLTEPWAVPSMPFEIEAGTLELSIEDLDRRFNLNALAGEGSSKNLTRFKTLLGSLGWIPSLPMRGATGSTPIAKRQDSAPKTAPTSLRRHRFEPRINPRASTSELALLSLLDADQLARLLPYVTALPTTVLKINVNTANAPSLESLSSRVLAEPNRNLVQSDRHYEDVNVLLAEVPELSDSVDAMAVVSSYFEIHARAEIDGYRTELTSEVYRDPTTGHITLLSRDFGKRLPSIVEAQEAQTQQTTSDDKKGFVELMRLFIRIAASKGADPHELDIARHGCCSTVPGNSSARVPATCRCSNGSSI